MTILTDTLHFLHIFKKRIVDAVIVNGHYSAMSETRNYPAMEI